MREGIRRGAKDPSDLTEFVKFPNNHLRLPEADVFPDAWRLNYDNLVNQNEPDTVTETQAESRSPSLGSGSGLGANSLSAADLASMHQTIPYPR